MTKDYHHYDRRLYGDVKKGKKPSERFKSYLPSIMSEICEEIGSTKRTLTDILKSDERYPSPPQFYKWVNTHEQAKEMYRKAKECQQYVLIDDVVEKASELNDEYWYQDSEGNYRVDSGRVSALKVEVDVKKWTAARFSPKIFGSQEDDKSRKESQEIRDKVDEELKDNVRDY